MNVHTIREALVITLLLDVVVGGADAAGKCSYQQYAEIGKEGIIKCSFAANTYSILWYDQTYRADGEPILVFLNSERPVDGYNTNEYDISDDGSLIIRNVTLNHERTYSVKILTSSFAAGDITEVFLRVVVKPSQNFPAISGCPKEDEFCYKELQDASLLTCFVECARPAINVTWQNEILPNTHSISNVSTCLENEFPNKTFASYATISYPIEKASLLSLLICEAATDVAGVLTKPRSLLLVEKRMHGPYMKSPSTVYAERHSPMYLKCFDDNLVVWKKGNETGYPTDLIAFAEFQQDNLTRVFFDNVRINSPSTLLFRRMEVKDEGMYFCISRDDVLSYQVIVTVPPRPPYLVVPGCGYQQYCVLDDVERQGNLTCKVHGIRPPVQLEWVAHRANAQAALSSIDTKVEIKGDAFDITHTSAYIADVSLEKVTVECRVKEPDNELFDMSTRLDLVFKYEMTANQRVTYDEPNDVYLFPYMVILMGLLILLLLLVSINLIWLKKISDRGRIPVRESEII